MATKTRTHDRDFTPTMKSHRSLPHLSPRTRTSPDHAPLPKRPPSRDTPSPMGPRPPGSVSPLSAGPRQPFPSVRTDSPRTHLTPSSSRADSGSDGSRSHSPSILPYTLDSASSRLSRKPSTTRDQTPAEPDRNASGASTQHRRRPSGSMSLLPSSSTPLSEAALMAYTASSRSTGNTSDSGPSARLDIKRLLSKPAPSTRSAPSESSDAPSYGSRPAPKLKYPSTSENESRGPSRALSTSGSRTNIDGSRSPSRSLSASAQQTPDRGRYGSRPPTSPASPSGRLKPSSKISEEASPRRASFSSSARRRENASMPESRDRKGISGVLGTRTSFSTMRQPGYTTPTGQSSPAPSTTRRSHTTPNLNVDPPPSRGGRSDSRTGDSRIGYTDEPPESPAPRSLTPAGQIMLAYKEQEKRRSTLAMMTSEEDRPSSSARRNSEDATPYYTVFGSTTGKVVAVGGPEDDAWKIKTDAYWNSSDARSVKSVSVGPTGVRRSLSRKVSSRLGRKGKNEGVSPVDGGRTEVYASRKSLQERRSVSLPKERRRSLRLSIEEDFVDMGDGPPTARSIPSMPNTPQGHTQESSGSLSRSASKLRKVRKEKEREREREEEESGGKLWKLMKRISTGALKDKYTSGSGIAPPPVPALPKDLSLMPIQTNFDSSTSSGSDGPFHMNATARFLSPRPSMSALRSPSAPPQTQQRSHTAPAAHPPKASGSSSAPRRSTTTRSSSPVSSSDVASSSKFFKSSPSARSSSSSYGDELPPPVPKGHVGQYIIPPSQLQHLHRLELDFMKATGPVEPAKRSPAARTMRQEDDPPPISAVDPYSVALAPRVASKDRRPPRSPGSATAHDPSPAHAAWPGRTTASAAASPVSPPRLPQSDFGRRSPPPRPRKSSKRGPPLLTEGLALTLPEIEPVSSISAEVEAEIRERRGERTSASTVRRRSSSFGVTPVDKSPVLFRAFGASPARQRTEREKAAMWDDLLDRSNRAGGTLHLGGDELLSDSLARLSLFSSGDI